jgi:chemotaxis signal transduction protein
MPGSTPAGGGPGRHAPELIAPGTELLLFRLMGRGYACLREDVRVVVDVGTGRSPVPGLGGSNLGALGAGGRPVAVASLRVVLGLPDLGPEGRILVVSTRNGPVGFLVDDVERVVAFDPGTMRATSSRFGGGYVTATVDLAGESWLLVDWDEVPLPPGLGSPPTPHRTTASLAAGPPRPVPGAPARPGRAGPAARTAW